jgi:hypothetical protein
VKYLLVAFTLGLIAAAVSTPANASSQAADINRCEAWIHARSLFPDAPAGELFVVSPNTACFDGDITSESVTPLDSWLTRAPAGSEPLVVVRSRGGDAATGIGIMQDLQLANAKVHVVDLCASSCANYLFAGAKHRSVTDGAVILFHGGFSAAARRQVLAAIERFRGSGKAPSNMDWDKARTSALASFDATMKLQDDLYEQIGVSNQIVRGMDMLDVDRIEEVDCDPTRSAKHTAVFFTVDQLRQMGITIEHGLPATKPAEVNARLRKLGSLSEACLAPRSYLMPSKLKQKI